VRPDFTERTGRPPGRATSRSRSTPPDSLSLEAPRSITGRSAGPLGAVLGWTRQAGAASAARPLTGKGGLPHDPWVVRRHVQLLQQERAPSRRLYTQGSATPMWERWTAAWSCLKSRW
jgi:hypothetical protein